MKLICSLFLLTSMVPKVSAELAPNHVGRALTDSLQHRATLSCSDVAPIAEGMFAQMDIPASCSSQSQNGGCLIKCDTPTMCCGEICGTLKQTIQMTSSFLPDWEKGCVTYTEGAGELSGKTRCAEMTYCGGGTSVCSCEAEIDNVACNSCSVCGTIPGTSLPYAVADCSNIAGGDLVSYECDDLDTFEELMDLSLQCGGEMYIKETYNKGGSGSSSVSAVFGMLLAVFCLIIM